MYRTLNYTIHSSHSNTNVGQFLRENGYSHTIIVHLKKTQDGIIVNGLRAYTNHILKEGDLLSINIKESVSSPNIVAVALPIDIVYEDADIMVLNKAADMPVHPSQNNHDNTLANGVAHYYATQKTPYVFRCINRLDRDTTGLLILSKHMLSAAILSQMMKDRQIERTYLALVDGVTDTNGTINAPIGRLEGSTIERIIDNTNGESAITHYKLLKTNGDVSLLEVHLDTGRTHQIRIHMKSIGHPLIGDSLYNPTSSLLNRQALHSHRLKFCHPITKKAMDFVCPLPNDMNLLK